MKTRRRPAAPPEGVELDLAATAEATGPVGNERDVDRLEALLGSGRRRPVLVGPSDTGKSAVVRGLALRIARGARPAGASAVWQVSLRTLDAQCAKDDSIGVWLAEILRAAAEAPSRPVVYVRDLWCLRRYDAEHDLTAALAQTRALFVGEAWMSFATWASESPELAAVTHIVRVEEPGLGRTGELLRLEAAEITRRDGVTFEPGAIDRVLCHADRLMPGRRMPGKAFGLLDEAAREAVARPDRRVNSAGVTDRVCDTFRLPRFLVDPDAEMDVEAIGATLRGRVVGQDDAVDALVQCLALHKADLGDHGRPLGVVLLAGPPGVGKTLLARLVAEQAFGGADRLVRLSMGEFTEDWKVDQLFGQRGAPTVDGRRGTLTRRLATSAFSVLLLDEIEKAHPLAFRHLLRPLDEGAFVNGNDEEVSLRNTLVVMTTSAGDEAYREPAVGFAAREGVVMRAASVRKRLADTFPSELLDRVDRIAVCPPLGPTELREVCRREILGLLDREGIAGRALEVEVDDEVLDQVVAEGLAAKGVRGLRRSLDRNVVRPLAAHILRATVVPGARVRVALHGGTVVPLDDRPPPTRPRPEVAKPRRGVTLSDAGMSPVAQGEGTGGRDEASYSDE